ncbi:MAG: type II toxin-antitoxin system HipA family toxin [Alphaproteobacteria bacterium]|nr:type II toxin-antitoxin system HipA family toxin [Alphaproteobacteria bacterium]
MKSALSVWWNDAIVGTLRLDEHGDTTFDYASDWLADADRPALSRSLPKQAEPFDRRRTRPFFAGLLPEEAQRDAVARSLGISKGNDFAFLKALGGDVAGALTLWPEGETPPAYDGSVAREPLGDNALVAMLDALPTRPFLVGDEGLRLSLAGAQSKIPVVLVDGAIALPAPGQPTTHILKPPMTRFPATTENEAFAMRLASAIGLSVASVEARRIKDRPFLLVERYDRAIDEAGVARRLHQEDFCQALGIPPELKYAAEGGPTFKVGFQLLRDATSRPALEVLKLLDAAIFQLIVGNADAHGKNYSLLYGPDGAVLAPLYDLLCTIAYPGVSPKLAMKIAGLATIEDLKVAPWTQFASDTGLGGAFVRRRVSELAESVRSHARDVAALLERGFDADALGRYRDIVVSRAEAVASSV